ncbi:hypothetical protein ACHWQZ_G013402 [Mnemiopsis leidyi]
MTGADTIALRDKLGLAIAYSTLLILALIGNSTIIVIYFKWKATFKIYKVTYIFLLSLTLANLAVAVGVMPLSIASLIAGQWVFGTTMCTINGFIFTWMATASILTILLISFHRATVVLSPLRRIIKTGPARIMAIFVWVFSLVVPLPPLFGISTYEYNPTRAFCRVRFVSYEADKASNIYSMTTVTLFVFLPLLVVSILNVALYRVSVRLLQTDGQMKKRGVKRVNSGRRISRTIRGELKAFTTVTLVVGIFVLCWAPQIILTMYGIITQRPYHDSLHMLQAVCIFLNSALNPYIYIYANKETRKRFAEIFLCRHPKQQVSFSRFKFSERFSSGSLTTAIRPLVRPTTTTASWSGELRAARPEHVPLRNNFVAHEGTDSDERLVMCPTSGRLASESDTNQTTTSFSESIQ